VQVKQAAIILAPLLAVFVMGGSTTTEPVIDLEKAGIKRIADFSAQQHATILFTISNQTIGYAKQGQVGWIGPTHEPQPGDCSWPHPSLSHDGQRVAYVTASAKSKGCRIVVYDLRTAASRDLVETTHDPGEISWSWDDSKIAYFEGGFWSVSIADGTKNLIMAFPLKDRSALFWVWYPMQWLHNGRDIVVEVEEEKYVKPGETTGERNLLLVTKGEARFLAAGGGPSVSPLTDQVAFKTLRGISVINADGTGAAELTKTPRRLFFSREEPFGSIVWAPDASRIFFNTIVSDDLRDKLFLFDMKSKRSDLFQAKTSIWIRGWR